MYKGRPAPKFHIKIMEANLTKEDRVESIKLCKKLFGVTPSQLVKKMGFN